MAQIDHASGRLGSAWRLVLGNGDEEREPPTEVRRPWLVAALAAAAASAALLTITGLGGLSLAIEGRPVTLVSEADLLEAALQEAPWVELGEEGAIVWAVAPVRCPECTPFFEEDLPALRAQGLRVRLILTAPRPPRAASASETAEVLRIRDPAPIRLLIEDRTLPAPRGADAVGAESRLEWARASYDRIAAILAVNGASMELPCLIWRRGPEWRAAFGRTGHGADHARRELAPGA